MTFLTKDLLDLKDRINKLPEPQASQRQTTKKRKPRAVKSQRASSLAEQLKTAGRHEGDRPQPVAEGFTDNAGMTYEAVTGN